MKIITINTDASFSNELKFWTYAYWIKWDWFHYKWSWVFKNKLNTSTEAEILAIAVWLWFLEQWLHDFDYLVINRDNIHANKKSLKNYLWRLRKKLKEVYWKKDRFIKFRHVKAHTRDLSTKKSYVNDWCDKECKKKFYKYKKELF